MNRLADVQYSDGEGPIAVLTPVEIEEEPWPEKSLTAPPPDESAPIEAEGESEGTGEDLPKELQRKGLIGFLTGRISVKIVVPFIVVGPGGIDDGAGWAVCGGCAQATSSVAASTISTCVFMAAASLHQMSRGCLSLPNSNTAAHRLTQHRS